MGKRIDIIYDLVFFIRRMKNKDRQSFRQFLSKTRSSEALIRMLRAFEKCDPHVEPMGLVKRLIILSGGSDYRLFQRFKSLLFEFELTSKRADYFKHQDNHYFLHIELKKEFLAAQMMTERDAYVTSINSMIETFKRAKKFDFLQIQKDCADNLSSYYGLTGDLTNSETWRKESKLLNKELIAYNSIYHLFEKKLNHIRCCNQHHQFHPSKIFNPSQSKIRKINLMFDILQLNERSPKEDPFESFKQSHKLFRNILYNPGLYPRHFRAVITKFVLEDLYILGKFKLLSYAAKKIYVLDIFPIYRRIPLMHFFLFYLLKTRNFRILDLLLDDIKEEKAFDQFQPFMEHKHKIEVLYLLLKNKPKEAIRLINRNFRTSNKCVFNDFDLRLAELICYYKCNNIDVIFNKLESLRRFVYRNAELRNSEYCKTMFDNIRSIILHQKLNSTISAMKEDENVYDLNLFFSSLISSLVISNSYAVQNIEVLKVAERSILPLGTRYD